MPLALLVVVLAWAGLSTWRSISVEHLRPIKQHQYTYDQSPHADTVEALFIRWNVEQQKLTPLLPARVRVVGDGTTICMPGEAKTSSSLPLSSRGSPSAEMSNLLLHGATAITALLLVMLLMKFIAP